MRQEEPADASPAVWLPRLARHVPPAEVVVVAINIGLKTSIAELLLINRLRARSLLDQQGQAAAKADADKAAVMVRFTHILGVTCKHWFPEDLPTSRRHQSKL